MTRRTLILPIGAGVIGMDDVPLVRIMDSDETPTSITAYGVVDTVQPVLSVTWTVNGVEQEGDVTKSPVLELTDLQPETSYAITLRATNVNGESQASTRTIWTKKITTITPADVVDGVTYYDYQDVYRTGTMPEMDETDITVSGRDVTIPAGHYAESETVSVSSEYIIPTGTKNINTNGTDDVTQYASVNVNVPASAVDTGTKQTNITTNGTQTFDVVGYANNEVTVNVQPNLETANVTPSTSPQTIVPTGNVDGYDRINVSAVTGAIDPNITPSNIKDGVTILGVTGSFDPTPDLGTLNVTPSTSAQTITPSGLDGWDEVDVAPVSSNIDPNIQAGNIKDGVTILGVTGTYQGGVQPSGTLNIVNNGIYDITNYANVNVQVAQGDYNELCFTAEEANCTVGMTHLGTNQTTTKPLMYYSTDNKQTWTSWDGSNITLANVGDKMYVYGDNLDGFNYSGNDRSQFATSGRVAASGNVMSLITRYGDREYIPTSSCFYYLFSGTTITTAPELPAITLTNQCYQNMFYNCTNLTTPPSVLPATKLKINCYRSMFYGCTNLTTTPELLATKLADSCCNAMFKYCSSLTTAPSVLPSTTLTSNCYFEMFTGCTNLTIAPELPATTLATNCYYGMFRNCSSLNYIKVLATSWNTSAATDWVSGVAATGTFDKPCDTVIPTATNGIPSGWTIIDHCQDDFVTFTANQANSTIRLVKVNQFPIDIKLYTSTDGTNFTQWDGSTITLANAGDKIYMYGDNAYFAYAPRLDACNSFSLNGDISVDGDITNLLTRGGTNTVPAYCFYRLFQGASGLTSAPELPATTLGVSCYEAMFVNCVNLTTAPSTLPATTLAERCYNSMFGDCSSLTTAPELPATTLAEGCYNSMFYNCSNLNSITCMATDISAANCTSLWVSNVAQTGTFRKNSQMSNWTTGDDGIPSGWTVVNV